MEYTRVNWKDYPDTDTTLSAKNLNVMDKGIADITTAVDELFEFNESTAALTINLDALS